MATRQGGFNGTRQIIDIFANGTMTSILATGPAKFVIVKESQLTSIGAPNTPQGFTYTTPNDAFAQLHETIPGDTLELGDASSRYNRDGSILGNGPGFIIGIGATSATILFKAQSLGATPTSIEVTQYYS